MINKNIASLKQSSTLLINEKVMKMYQNSQEITLDFLKQYTPNIFEGVEKIKKYIADLAD